MSVMSCCEKKKDVEDFKVYSKNEVGGEIKLKRKIRENYRKLPRFIIGKFVFMKQDI